MGVGGAYPIGRCAASIQVERRLLRVPGVRDSTRSRPRRVARSRTTIPRHRERFRANVRVDLRPALGANRARPPDSLVANADISRARARSVAGRPRGSRWTQASPVARIDGETKSASNAGCPTSRPPKQFAPGAERQPAPRLAHRRDQRLQAPSTSGAERPPSCSICRIRPALIQAPSSDPRCSRSRKTATERDVHGDHARTSTSIRERDTRGTSPTTLSM